MPYDIYKCTKFNDVYAYGVNTGLMWALAGRDPKKKFGKPEYSYTELSHGVREGTLMDRNGRVFERIDGTYEHCRHIPEEFFKSPVQSGGNPKDAQGRKKVPLHLIPAVAQVHLARAFNDGVQKYGQANWRKSGVNASVYVSAAQRHLALWYDGGEELADDSKVHHLGHAMACLAIILDAQQCGKLNDDRPDAVPGLANLFKNPENPQ